MDPEPPPSFWSTPTRSDPEPPSPFWSTFRFWSTPHNWEQTLLGVLLAMLPQLRGVETEVRFHAPEAFQGLFIGANKTVDFGAYPCAINSIPALRAGLLQSTLCTSHGNPACQPATPSRFWHDMFFLHAFRVGFCTDVTLIFCMILLARGPFGVARIGVANLQMRTLKVEVEEGSM